MSSTSTTKAHCNGCQGNTNQAVLHEVRVSLDDIIPGDEEEYDDYYLSGYNKYQMLRCLGCDAVQLRHERYIDQGDDLTTTYYPPATARPEPKWLNSLYSLQSDVYFMLKEIYAALHNGSHRLTAIGVHSLLEQIMIDKIGDKGSFGANVRVFRDAGFLSQRHADFLNTVIEAGHASTHRAWKPKDSEFHTLMDITESIVETVYVLDSKITKLRKEIPPRPTK